MKLVRAVFHGHRAVERERVGGGAHEQAAALLVTRVRRARLFEDAIEHRARDGQVAESPRVLRHVDGADRHSDRFDAAIRQIVGKRLTYSELTGKERQEAF